MASQTQDPTLNFPHEVREWEEGGTHHCALSVTMPDGTTMSFGGKGQSARSARTFATFNAHFAVNMKAFDGDSKSSDDIDKDDDCQRQDDNHMPLPPDFGAEERLVEKDPIPMQFVEAIEGDEQDAFQGLGEPPPRQSDSDHNDESEQDFDDQVTLTAVQATLNDAQDPIDYSVLPKPPQFVEAKESSTFHSDRCTSPPPPPPEFKNDQRPVAQEMGKNTGKIARKVCTVDAESNSSESSSDAVEFVNAVIPPQVKKRPLAKASLSRGSQVEHPRKKPVLKRKPPVTSSARLVAERVGNETGSSILPSKQAGRSRLEKPRPKVKRNSAATLSKRTGHVTIRSLFSYSDDESDDSSPPQVRVRRTADPSPEAPGSSSESEEDMDSRNAVPKSDWHSGRKGRPRNDRQPLPLAKRRKEGSYSSRLVAAQAKENARPSPQEGSGHTGKSYIVEPSVPGSNIRNGSATVAGYGTERFAMPALQAGWNTVPRAAGDMASQVPFPRVGSGKPTRDSFSMPSQQQSGPVPPKTWNCDSRREHSNGTSSRRGRHSFGRGNERGRTTFGIGNHSMNQGMNEMPIHSSMNGAPMPMPLDNAMPMNPTQGPIFPDPRLIATGQAMAPPFPAPSHMPPLPMFTTPMPHQQFAPHQMPHSMPGPFPYGSQVGGMPFSFGQGSKSDIEANLASIRRVAIANAQAAVEKDLRDSANARIIRDTGGTSREGSKRNFAKPRPVVVDVDSEMILSRNETENRKTNLETVRKRPRSTSTSDSDASRKRRRLTKGNLVEAAKETPSGPSTNVASKESTPTTLAKTLTPEPVPEAGELSSGDELDGGEHITALHELVRRIKACKFVKYGFDRRSGESGPWICTVRVTRAGEKEAESPIQMTVGSRSKQMAKRKASKRMINVLKDMFPDENRSEPNDKSGSTAKPSEARTGAPLPPEGGSLTTAAVGALNELWLCRTLENQPDARLEAVDGAMWKCTFLLKVTNHGLVKVSEIGSSKKIAKRYAAHKALDRLKELQAKGAEKFLRVKSLAEARDAEAALLEETEAEPDMAAMEDVVRLSDDEKDDAQEQDDLDEMEGLFVLPKGYVLTIAKSRKDCELWVKDHLAKQSDVGFFVGSCDSSDITMVAKNVERGATKHFPVVCFSSSEAGLVLRADKCTDSESKEFDIINGLWLPRAVRGLLRDRNLRKHGYEFDMVIMRLWEQHGIRARSVNDISVTSFGVNGFGHNNGNKILWTMAELTKHWLQKESVGMGLTETWADSSDAPDSLKERDNGDLGAAALHAYGCLQMQERVEVAAIRRRAQLYGPAAEFQELCKRLMYSPFA